MLNRWMLKHIKRENSQKMLAKKLNHIYFYEINSSLIGPLLIARQDRVININMYMNWTSTYK